ncbi:MAG: nitrile hydratase subunit alpha [Alphaproteobacteria bacterium]
MSEHAHDNEHEHGEGGHDHAHEHGAGGDHDHAAHAPVVDQEPDGEPQFLARAVRELLIEKGYFTADQMRAMIEKIDERGPALGAKIVARAWVDPAYKARLLKHGKAAVAELGIDVVVADLVVVENTDRIHNVIVCTLCSCYPVFVLGRPPDWYKSAPYRSRVVKEPRAVLREFGTEIADHVEVRVHDSSADMRYLVLPQRPAGTEGWSEERLAELITRDSMIGVARAKLPA